MWYLKKFSTESDYQAFKGGEDWLTQNVSSIKDTNGIYYNPATKDPVIISFTIYGGAPLFYPDKTYQAIDGMTFEDFCNSKYNIDGWQVVESEIEGIYKILHQYDDFISDGSSINSYEIINPDKSYYWMI